MENTNTNEKYYRQNGEVVEGKDIPAVRTQQLKDTIRNGRLGTYNAHGRYILSPRVTNEIFGITKYVYKQHYDEVLKESKDVLEFKATASIPVFGQMEFRFVFKDHIARLYMIENVYREFNGYQEIYGEQITEINCEDDRDSVVDYVFALLNVKVVDEVDFGKIPDEDPEKVRAIIFDKLYLTMVAKNYLKESSDDERDTFEEMINDLKGGGEYGKRVLKHFIDRIEKRPDIMQLKDEDGYNEALNDALIGALEVATTEEDMKDPHNKKLYEDLYKKRFKNTEEDLKKAQEKVNEKDLKKVADGVLGRGTSDKLYTEEELASLIDGKREETKQAEQDNSFVDDLLKNPIVKQVIENVAGHTVGENREENQGASRTGAEEEAQAANLGGDAYKRDNDPKPPPGGQGPNDDQNNDYRQDNNNRRGGGGGTGGSQSSNNENKYYDYGTYTGSSSGGTGRSSSNSGKNDNDKQNTSGGSYYRTNRNAQNNPRGENAQENSDNTKTDNANINGNRSGNSSNERNNTGSEFRNNYESRFNNYNFDDVKSTATNPENNQEYSEFYSQKQEDNQEYNEDKAQNKADGTGAHFEDDYSKENTETSGFYNEEAETKTKENDEEAAYEQFRDEFRKASEYEDEWAQRGESAEEEFTKEGAGANPEPDCSLGGNPGGANKESSSSYEQQYGDDGGMGMGGQ